jgi:hypothetical protein
MATSFTAVAGVSQFLDGPANWAILGWDGGLLIKPDYRHPKDSKPASNKSRPRVTITRTNECHSCAW